MAGTRHPVIGIYSTVYAGRYHPKHVIRLRNACTALGYDIYYISANPIRFPDNLAAVWILGGDGTIQRVIAAMQGAGIRCPIGITPLGTCNVIAQEVGAHRYSQRGYFSVLARWRVRRVYTGLYNTTPFLMGVSTGLDAACVHGVSLGLKRVIGRYAYLASFLRCYYSSSVRSRSLVILRTRDAVYAGTGCIIMNSGYYAGPFRLLRTGVFDSGLTAIIHTCCGVYDWFLFLLVLLFGRLLWHPRVQIVRLDADATLITQQPVQCDGDPVFGEKTSRMRCGQAISVLT